MNYSEVIIAIVAWCGAPVIKNNGYARDVVWEISRDDVRTCRQQLIQCVGEENRDMPRKFRVCIRERKDP